MPQNLMSSKRIALFAGNDLSTSILLPHVVKEIRLMGWAPTVYFPQTPLRSNSNSTLREFSFYERILPGFVHQVLDRLPLVENAACYSPNGLAKKYQIPVNIVKSVNSPDFLAEMKHNKFDGALSIRCLQIFKPPFLQLFNKNNNQFLWNLHSGALPHCRGAMPLFWTMLNRKPQATLSLHEIVDGIDEGWIIAEASVDILPEYSLLDLSCHTSTYGAALLCKALQQQALGVIKPIIQHDDGSHYYSYPKPEDIQQFEAFGARLVPLNIIDKIVKLYANDERNVSKLLKATLERHAHDFQRQNQPLIHQPAHAFFQQEPQAYDQQVARRAASNLNK